MAMVTIQRKDFVNQITPIASTGPEYINLTDDLSGEEYERLY